MTFYAFEAEIRHITKIKEGRFKEQYLVGLSILNDKRILYQNTGYDLPNGYYQFFRVSYQLNDRRFRLFAPSNFSRLTASGVTISFPLIISFIAGVTFL
jgi:hypothetical protein